MRKDILSQSGLSIIPEKKIVNQESLGGWKITKLEFCIG
jgi:hypothetical protein